MDFPTLGLNFDLNELVEGLRRLAQAKTGFTDVGRAADQAGDQVETAGRQMTEASLKAEAAAFRAARANETEEQSVRSKMRQLRDLERILRDIDRVERMQKRIDPQAKEYENQQRAVRALGQTIELVARENERAANKQRESWRRVADAIRYASDQTVRAAQADAEARVRITQAEIAQNRQNGLTRESLTKEALLVDRLTKELNELGQARANAARQGAPAGANADLLGAAAATSVVPVIGAAKQGLNNRAAQLAENEAREKGRRGIGQYILALVGLGVAYDGAGRKQQAFGGALGGFGNLLRQLRLRAFDLRFALAALFGALTLGPLAAMADQMVALESRTRLYAKTASDVPRLLEETYQVAQRSRASLEGVATLYTRLAPLGDSLGRSQAQLLRIVETVSKAFSIGGAAASEATAGAQQFAQALSSNRFGGDELRSVAENAPVLLAAIAEGVNQINPSLNLNAATFIKWAQAGNANSEIMVQALEKARDKIDRMFASTTPTISQGTVVIRNALTKLVDEVDRRSGEAGLRLSTNIAMGLQEFAEFLTKDSTVDAMVNVVNAIKVAFDVAGAAIKGVVTYFPALITAMIAFTAATKGAMIATAFTGVMRGMGAIAAATSLQFTAAGGGLAIFSGAASVASAAAVRLGMALKGALAFLAGPFGLAIALTAIVAGFSYMNSKTLEFSEAMNKVTDRTEASVNAMERAVMFLKTYGGESEAVNKQMEEMNDTINKMIGITDDQTRGMDAATQAAFRRAKMEQQLTVALLRRAAAESISAAGDLNRSAMFQDVKAWDNSVTSAGILPITEGGRRNKERWAQSAQEARDAAAFQRRLARQLTDQAPGLMNAADALERAPIVLPEIEDGSGVSNLGGNDDKAGKGMAGAINAVAKLRAEVAGLNAQIAALSIDPLSDVSARIIAAGREAAASRTAGKGAGFADEAQRLAMLKEEASIRLELSRTIISQNAASVKASEESRISLWANGDAVRAMQGYYDGSVRSSERYAQALYAQQQAEIDGEKTMENLRLAQQFGVTSVSEISRAYQATLEDAGLLTDETKAYADQLQAQAEAALRAAEAAIDLNTQLERQRQFNAAILTQRARIDDMQQYAAALRGGAAALDEYNRQKRIQAQLDAEGPAPTFVGRILQPLMARLRVAQEDEASYSAEYEKRSAEMREQLRLAELTTRERQIEVEAMELAAAAGRTLANEADRAAARILVAGREAAALATTVQDSIRQGFIDTGKLSFDSLRDALKKSIRQAIYDELIAKPVNMVVKAVIDFTQKGLEEILAMIKRSMGGAEGDSWGDVLGKFFGSGGKFDTFMSRFGDIGSKIGNFVKGAGKVLGQAGAGYQIGSTIGDMVGLEGSGDGRQQMLDMAASVIGSYFGGPIGAALATLASRVLGGFIFDKKRPLAITAVEVRDGRFVSRGSQGYDGGPTEEIGTAGRELANMLNKLTDIFGLSLRNAEGLYAVFGWTAGENTKSLGGEGFFGGLLKEFDSIRGMSLDQIKGSALGRGVDLSQVKDAEEALDKIMREVVIRIGEVQEVPFSEAEKALIRAAESLEEAAATLKAARNIETDIQRALLQFTNPREFAVQNLRDQQFERRKGILDLVNQGLVTEDRLPGIETMLRELERAELADVLSRFVGGIDGVISSLEDLRKAQERIAEYAQGLITGNLSPLSPSAQLVASQAEFQRLLAAANAGDASAMEKLTSASTDYLSAAQQYFASSPQYAAIFDQVYNQLLALSQKEFEDPLIGVIEAEVQRLIDAINAGFLLIHGDGEEPGAPVIPDVPSVPGGGGGGSFGGGGSGYGGGGNNSDLVNLLAERFDGLQNQVAFLGDAVVAANDRNGIRVVQGVTRSSERSTALAGGLA